jgi:hypothetical protein
MFQFSAFPVHDWQEMNPARFPDLGHPRIKACLAAPRGFSQLGHDLLRLWTPRHPPCTLSSLTTLFLELVADALLEPSCFQRTTPSRGGLNDLCANDQDGGGDRTRTDDPLVANQMLYQLSYAPLDQVGDRLVGLTGFEPVTSRLSGERSNQLSYRP